jgi:hypothetical protein
MGGAAVRGRDDNTITLRLEIAGEGVLGYSLALDFDCARALAPLPRDRELGGWAAIDALAQIESRRRYARILGESLTAAVMDMIRERDPVDGYDRAQLAAMELRRGLRP